MRSALLLSIVVALGCTDPSSPSAPPRPPDNKGGNGAEPIDAGPRLDGSEEDLLSPVIEIRSPEPASDPNEDPILTDSSVTVSCHAEASKVRGAYEIDRVRIEATSLVDPMKRVMGVVTAMGTEDFEAELDLGEFPNGGVRFICAADHAGMPGMPMKNTTVAVDSLLDLGPTVNIIAPKDDSIHALMAPVRIEFEVLPSPVADGDDGADVASIDLRVLDQEFEFEETSRGSGRYAASIPFNDTTIFQMAPSNADIVVSAYNARKPNAVERSAEVSISLDSKGPSITIVSPTLRSIVRGQIQLAVKISDPSGVQNSSVIGRINMDKFILDEWEVVGDMYTAQFDTRAAIFTDLPDITIDVTASDMVGNESTENHQLRLDNVPPLVSIDPPKMREWFVEGAITRCSMAFDPLGNAASDGDNVDRAVMFRAIVNEETNSIQGGAVKYVAGVDETSMRLYARHDDDIPLLIDTDDDGKCDDINSEMLSEEDRPAVVTLTPMDIRGTAPYVMGTQFDETDHTVPAGYACTSGTPTELPGFMCNSGITRVVSQTIEGSFKALYSLAPAQGLGLACNGNTWTLEPIVGEGWACVAASVVDNIGNRGISRPIRVCIDDGTDPPPSCRDDKVANPPPSCVDGCTLPDDFEVNRMLRLQ